ncbi:NepR family anti-sigma factor [Neoroseomonas rubea]|uniref:NepR family anti-sigma factor n=1 Tax=Neoroseomonas rubea TaxID=2748666 RepID=UPI0018DFC868
MAESDDPEQKPEAKMPDADARDRKRRKGTPDAAFDVWLRRGLHAMFDEVAQEPIPEELIRLIEADRRK